MNTEFTRTQPTEPGYYFWTHGGEHTPTVMHVTKLNGNFYATDGEYEFRVKKKPDVDTDKDRCPVDLVVEGRPWYYGESLWAGPIPLPTLNGDTIQPDSF